VKFVECDACAEKPGSPNLCAGCLNNRTVIDRLSRPELTIGVNNEWSLLVLHFQSRFNQAYTGRPRELPASVAALRKKLVLEETQELVDAIDRGELVEQLDAIVDLLYVTIGTANAMGFYHQLDTAFKRVHEANVKKILVESRHGSKRDSQWDIVKPEGWVKPDLSDLIGGPTPPFTNRDPRGGE
jgi:predicted HAD superfamily Cof-like phosphohydrolase